MTLLLDALRGIGVDRPRPLVVYIREGEFAGWLALANPLVMDGGGWLWDVEMREQPEPRGDTNPWVLHSDQPDLDVQFGGEPNPPWSDSAAVVAPIVGRWFSLARVESSESSTAVRWLESASASAWATTLNRL